MISFDEQLAAMLEQAERAIAILGDLGDWYPTGLANDQLLVADKHAVRFEVPTARWPGSACPIPHLTPTTLVPPWELCEAMDKDNWLAWLRHAVLGHIEMHERDEFLLVKGIRAFDPHAKT